MVKLLLHLCLASILSGVTFTPVIAMAQDETDTSTDLTSVEATTPPTTTNSRAPAADSSATPAPAASNAVKTGKGEKIKNLNFEDELVQGAADKPELFYLFQKKNFNYKRLIKLRENFLPEMRKTSEEVQRVRSQD